MTSTYDSWLNAQASSGDHRHMAMVDVPPFTDGAVAELRHGADGTVIAEIRIDGPAMVPGDSVLAHALRRLAAEQADPDAVDAIANHDSYV